MEKDREAKLITLRPGTYTHSSYTTTVDSTGLATLTVTSSDTYKRSLVYLTNKVEAKAGDLIEVYFRGKSGTSNVIPGFCDFYFGNTMIISNNTLKYNSKYSHTVSNDATAETLSFYRRSGSALTLPFTTEYYVELYVNGELKVGRV